MFLDRRPSAAIALVCGVVISSLLARCAGHPVFYTDAVALKREKRTGSCSELKLAREFVQDVTKNAPHPLLELLGRANPGQFVRFTARDREWEESEAGNGGRRKVELCKGRTETGNSEEDIFVLMDGAPSPAEVGCWLIE